MRHPHDCVLRGVVDNMTIRRLELILPVVPEEIVRHQQTHGKRVTVFQTAPVDKNVVRGVLLTDEAKATFLVPLNDNAQLRVVERCVHDRHGVVRVSLHVFCLYD